MPTIFAPITSTTKGGICVIRISGPSTVNCLKSLGFSGTPEHKKVSFQKLRDPKTSQVIDEVLISYFQNPQSFTGEDVAEISIHASSFIAKKVFEILGDQKNCRMAEPGEFSKKAFLNGKMDLVQAEAIVDLIACETEAQHKQALNQLEGKLGKIYEDWRFRLIEISAMLEAAIDFPDEDLPKNICDKVEEDVEKLSAEIVQHLDDKKIGQKIKEGLSLAIIGAPNVGKSSLINFLAQSEIAIVSEIAGTTRDVVETHLAIAGVAVKISDTAGIRETEDKIEKEGIRRALQKAALADIKIFMLDAANPVFREDLIDENTIVVVNKSDITPAFILDAQHRGPLALELQRKRSSALQAKDDGLGEDDAGSDDNAVHISLTQNLNTNDLLKKLEEKIRDLIPAQNSPLITQERYRVALKNSVENLENFSLNKNIELAAEDLRMTAREIGKITGKIDVENILNVIFSRFCIGK